MRSSQWSGQPRALKHQHSSSLLGRAVRRLCPLQVSPAQHLTVTDCSTHHPPGDD